MPITSANARSQPPRGPFPFRRSSELSFRKVSSTDSSIAPASRCASMALGQACPCATGGSVGSEQFESIQRRAAEGCNPRQSGQRAAFHGLLESGGRQAMRGTSPSSAASESHPSDAEATSTRSGTRRQCPRWRDRSLNRSPDGWPTCPRGIRCLSCVPQARRPPVAVRLTLRWCHAEGAR